MRLLDTIKVVGQHHADWQALHRKFLDLPRAQYSKLSGNPDKLATILEQGGVLQKRLDTGEGSVICCATKVFVANTRHGHKSPPFGCSGCDHHCIFPNGHWRLLKTFSGRDNADPRASTRGGQQVFHTSLRDWLNGYMVTELPDIHRVDYDDFMQVDPSTPYVWSDGTPGATSPDALNRLQAYYAARLGYPPPKSTHVHQARVW
jgi:hypothetical protein